MIQFVPFKTLPSSITTYRVKILKLIPAVCPYGAHIVTITVAIHVFCSHHLFWLTESDNSHKK